MLILAGTPYYWNCRYLHKIKWSCDYNFSL